MTLRAWLFPLTALAVFLATATVGRAAPAAASSSTQSTGTLPAHTSGHSAGIIPLAEVRAGMKGYGLTVFSGTKPERFDIRVIGVLHNFLPKQDVILIQSDDPRLLHSGIVAGMSGSPIYIEGRLAGALAYGWHFAKDPIAGVTPIETMLTEMRRPLRGRLFTPMAEAANERHRSLDSLLAERAPKNSDKKGLLSLLPLPPRLIDGASSSLVRASVPLSLAGFGASTFDELTDALKQFHVIPMQAGGGSRNDGRGPSKFEDGGSIAVELIRGDVSAAATGTVTHVDGNKLVAFGHPMFNVGEVYLPVATAEIHTFMSALSTSFKLASPMKEIGSLVQDRQACIVGDTSQRADMIPVNVTVGGAGRKEESFHAEVVRHRFLTPMLAAGVIANSAQTAASDVSDATITVRSNLAIRGYKPLELVDHIFSPDGVSPRTLASSGGLKAIGEILFNPFAPANIDKIDVRVDVDYKADVAEIVGVSLNSDELEAGSRPNLYVTLRPYAGQEYIKTIPVEIPEQLTGQNVKVVVTAGNLAKPDTAPPENLSGLIDNLRKSFPAKAIVVSLETPDEGVTLRGSVIPDLPGSVIDTLRPGASTRRADTYKRASRIVVDTPGVIAGKQEITIHVKDDPAK